MESSDDRGLQNSDDWDLDNAVVMQPLKRPRAVVSVSFSADDLDAVSEMATKLAMRTSEFIRQAALEKAGGKGSVTTIELQGVSGGSYSVDMHFGPTTRGTAIGEIDVPEPTTA